MATEMTLTKVGCPKCATPFSMYEELYQSRRRDGQAFYCPNGHAMYIADSDAKKLADAIKDKQYWEQEAQRLLAENDKLLSEIDELRGVSRAARKSKLKSLFGMKT